MFVKVQTTASPLPTGMPVTLRPSPATVPSTCSPSRQNALGRVEVPVGRLDERLEAACWPVFTCTAPVVDCAGAVAFVVPSTFSATDEYGAGTCWPSGVR